MMHPARSVPPLNAAGVGHGRRSSATAWTGEKRRKTVGAPSPSLGLGSDDADATEAMLMDAQVQEEELVFSAESVLDFDELALCYEVLQSRENHIYPSFTARLDQDGKQKVVERYYRYRYIDFKLKEGTASLNLDDTTDTVPMSEYPDEVLEFESPNKPGRGMFGWTFDLKTFDYANLDDYQRMVPKRASLEEYSQWDKYRLAFSNYETDEEYVKYWGELFKKIKWIEEYIHLDYYEFARYKTRGASHAMKIAQRFCHLPASLATLGYNEYLNALDDSFDLREDNGRVYLELWKRMTRQGMSFQDALQDILASDNKLPTPCLHRIKSTIMGYEYDILSHFRTCEKHIGKHIVDDDDDDTVLKLITDVLNTKIKRQKWYVDYAKTKLDVARRIRMLPGMARAGEGLRTAHPKL